MRFHSIMFKLRLAFLAPFAFFMLAIVYILSVYYRESAVEDMMGQLRYEDEIIAQSLEAKIRNAETLVNTVIIQLNEILGVEYLSGGGKYLGFLFKAVGITYVCEFCASICKDAGYGAVAGQIEIFGKLSILLMGIPVLVAVIENISAITG